MEWIHVLHVTMAAGRRHPPIQAHFHLRSQVQFLNHLLFQVRKVLLFTTRFHLHFFEIHMSLYTYSLNGSQEGPFDAAAVATKVWQNPTGQHLVWTDGMANWADPAAVPEINDILTSWKAAAAEQAAAQPPAQAAHPLPASPSPTPQPATSSLTGGLPPASTPKSPLPLILGIGGGVLVLAVAAWFLFLSKPSETDAADAGETQRVSAPLPVSSVIACNHLSEGYRPENVSDGVLSTWWTPSGSNKSGYGAWLQINFAGTRTVTAVEIHNGSHHLNYPGYGDLYFLNNRITKAKLDFSDGQSEVVILREIDEIQKVSFTPHKTTFVRFEPIVWEPGSQWQDLCVSHFMAQGY